MWLFYEYVTLVAEDMAHVSKKVQQLLQEVQTLRETCPLPADFQAVLGAKGVLWQLDSTACMSSLKEEVRLKKQLATRYYHVPSGIYHAERRNW